MTFKAASELFTEANIFVIPTFQRPYAWEQSHREDMIRDIQVATARQRHNPNTIHYFGAIHTIEVQPDSALLTNYSDPANEDINTLSNNGFQATDSIFRVHLVVDGQQRLVTLFGLLERCAGSKMRYVTMPNERTIPKVILSPATDHELWRSLLGMGNPVPPMNTRSQRRLQELFAMPPQPPFIAGSPEHRFLIGAHTELVWVQLPRGATLGPFLTLNDRGKDLTKLEKIKSLAMEADENGGFNQAQPLNTSFGRVYLSIDLDASLLNEDDFLRQLAICLWEPIAGQNYGAAPDQLYPRAHDGSLESIYQSFRALLSGQGNNPAGLVGDVVAKSSSLATRHSALANRLTLARAGNLLGVPSFVNGIIPASPQRDALDDYVMVLDSLGLQAKQLAILLAVPDLCGTDWHAVLGQIRLSNQAIKQDLIALYNEASANVPSDMPWKQVIRDEIETIPDQSVRDVTPLYVAELLRLIVGGSKPGGFTAAWQQVCVTPPIAGQSFLDAWRDYLSTYDSRDKFVGSIARSQYWDNQSASLRYLLREYECCLPQGLPAHRLPEMEIEHFFGQEFRAIRALAIPGRVFVSKADYISGFVDRPGNKLLIPAALNRALRVTPVLAKPHAYGAHLNTTAAARQVSNDLNGVTQLALMRDYVLLRQVRLAAFAAKRF
ncbi:DUF262 domain-containing protein [Lamprocystis purpurea]|jgi:hypothetical protein|uniref:DUF262 domain-containing protein n=1 Tax=Lamprocystis purpurea TaxID=61598 RepID=UPI00036EEF30|nr:DUF262 domain-containing protein [Lamprocystis purpurea]